MKAKHGSTIAVLTVASALLSSDGFANDHPLTQPIVVRVEQAGFAGVTGVEYKLSPDGKFEIRRLLDKQTTGEVDTGQLAPEKLTSIARLVAATDLASLPVLTTVFDGVNPAAVQVEYGDSRLAAVLPPGFVLTDPCPQGAEAGLCQVLDLARSIQTQIDAE